MTGCTSTHKEFIIKKEWNPEELSKAKEVWITLSNDSTLILSKVVMEEQKLRGVAKDGSIEELEMSDDKTIKIKKSSSIGWGTMIGIFGIVLGICGIATTSSNAFD